MSETKKVEKIHNTKVAKIVLSTRYLILLPIIGLILASAVFFFFGGIGLLKLLYDITMTYFGFIEPTHNTDKSIITYEVIEYVHTFLVGTVLYITAIGFYQLFIKEIKFPRWLRVTSTEQLETNLIGVTVVVLAVNFMGAVFAGATRDILTLGVGMGAIILSLAVFLGMRSWADKRNDKEKD